MNDLLKALSANFNADTFNSLGRQIGASPEATRSAVNAALPVLVGMLANNTQSSDGEQALARAVEKDHDGSILGRIDDFFGSGDTAPGQRILGHVFGQRQAVAEQGLAERTGLGSGQIQALMALLAPIVLGALGQQSRASSGATGGGGLSDLLQGAMGDLLSGQGGQMGSQVLGGLLGDAKNGKLGDLGQLGGSLLGRLFKRR